MGQFFPKDLVKRAVVNLSYAEAVRVVSSGSTVMLTAWIVLYAVRDGVLLGKWADGSPVAVDEKNWRELVKVKSAVSF